MRHNTLLSVGIAACLAVGIPMSAHAANITVVGYTTPDDPNAFYSVTTAGYSYYTGPVGLNLSNGSTIFVYCVDLNHELHAGDYSPGPLALNGLGVGIDQALSNTLGQIADIGINALLVTHDLNMATAAQAAIWDLEYGVTSTFADPSGAIANDVHDLVTATYTNDGTTATAIIPFNQGWFNNQGASQEMIVGSSSSVTTHQLTDVPEPASLFVIGAGMLGLTWARRKKIAG
jgi:PEP-CTERM motif